MAYAARSVSFVSDETAGRNNFANSVKGSDQALLAAVIFPAAGADDLQHFEDKGALGREAHLVANSRREPVFNNLPDRLPDALSIDGDVSDVVALGSLFDDCRLLFKLKPSQLLQFNRAKPAASHKGRDRYGQSTGITIATAAVGVVAQPHLTLAHRATGERFPVGPVVIPVSAAPQ